MIKRLLEYLDLIGKGMALFFAVILMAGFVVFILMAAYHTTYLAFCKHWIYGSILFTCWALLFGWIVREILKK
jgi:uncharacterized membrane protein (DUF485 family)